MRKGLFWLGILIAIGGGPQVALAHDAGYDAASGQFPDELLCQPWVKSDTADPEEPALAGGILTLSTSLTSEGMWYKHSDTMLSMPAQLVIEARLRYVSGFADVSTRAPVLILFTTEQDRGNALFIGNGEIFINADNHLRDQTAFVPTSDAFHTYRIEVDTVTGGIQVLYDGVPALSGSLFVSAPFNGSEPRVLFGEGSIHTYSTSEWMYVKHNAHAGPGGFGAACLRLSAMADGTLLEWQASTGAAAYDIVRGDLAALRSSGYTAATDDCLADDEPGTSFLDGTPPPDDGFWYLVRDVGAAGTESYDTEGLGQQTSRDADINGSPLACP